MSPTPSGSLALQHFKLGDVLEIRDGIIFEFYPGLPHTLLAGLLDVVWCTASTYICKKKKQQL